VIDNPHGQILVRDRFALLPGAIVCVAPTQTAAAQAETELQRILTTPAATDVSERIVYAPAPTATGSSRKTTKVAKAKRTQVVTSKRKARRVAVVPLTLLRRTFILRPCPSTADSFADALARLMIDKPPLISTGQSRG
jgi:hypothetical protein